MRRSIALFCLLAAWLCASGAVLDGVQVYAWGRMFMGYARQMPVNQAAAETMDGNKPCSLCLALRRAREQEQHEQPAVALDRDVVKLVLIADEPATLVFARECEPWPPVVAVRPPSRARTVLLTPPRAVAPGWVA
jgi:hypothetical protein